MRISKTQFHRFARIASLLKQNRYPNPESLVRDFERIHIEDELSISCSEKTVLRDIQILKHEFDCPIAYSREFKGYYLKHHNWEFNSHSLVAENEMMAAVLGAKIAEDIFPDPIRGKIKRAADELLAHNNPDFLDTAQIESLKIFGESFGEDSPAIFLNVFNAWLQRHSLKISYENRDGSFTERMIEPHVLVYFENVWGIKAFCHLRGQVRTFLISRIHEAEMLASTFIPNEKIIRNLTVDTFLSYPKVKDVKIRLLSESARKFALKKKMHSRQKITKEKGSESYLLKIPAVAEEVIVPWILAQQGEAVPLEPECIRESIKIAAEKTLSSLSGKNSK